jgi:hypothetical protein
VARGEDTDGSVGRRSHHRGRGKSARVDSTEASDFTRVLAFGRQVGRVARSIPGTCSGEKKERTTTALAMARTSNQSCFMLSAARANKTAECGPVSAPSSPPGFRFHLKVFHMFTEFALGKVSETSSTVGNFPPLYTLVIIVCSCELCQIAPSPRVGGFAANRYLPLGGNLSES